MLIASLVEIAFAGLLVWIWFGARPSSAKFAAANELVIDDSSLPAVRTALGRTYQGRVLGALIGAVLLGAAMLPIGVGAAVAGGFIGLFAGTMVGIALAQRRARPDPGVVRHASLDARTVESYAPSHATGSVFALAAACVGVVVVVVIAAPNGLGPFAPALVIALASLLIIPVGRWLQRRIVEAPRGAIAPDVDDALRVAAVRTVHHAVLGVLVCGLAAASLTGVLTQWNLTVEDNDGTVFAAPPGTTSISVDTGLRQTGGPNAPVRIFWIEADGSEHQTGWMTISGPSRYGSADLSWIGRALSLLSLFAVFALLVQWHRATSAWRRGRSGSHPEQAPLVRSAHTTGGHA